jgi:hypothetical protein
MKSRFAKSEPSKPSPAKTEAKAPKEKSTLTSRQQTAPEATKNIDDMSKQEAIEYLTQKIKFRPS